MAKELKRQKEQESFIAFISRNPCFHLLLYDFLYFYQLDSHYFA